MFDFLFKKNEFNRGEFLNAKYEIIKNLYSEKAVSEDRKKELGDLIGKFGYLPYSQMRALRELTAAETVFCLEKKLSLNGSLQDGKPVVQNNNTSPVKRAGYTDGGWLGKEQHDIKLINLAALGDCLENTLPAKFIDWLKQIVILPCGNVDNKILSTTVYLVPFHPRDFGNAYLTASMEEVCEKITDDTLKKAGICAKEQVQLFIMLAQSCGHPVIYDVFPQTGRFSKTVLVHPEIARWLDVNYMIDELTKAVEEAAVKLSKEIDEDDVTIVKNIYKSALKNGYDDNLTNEYKPIYERFNKELEEKRKSLSNFITKKEEQQKLQKRVKLIVEKIEGKKDIKCDKDLTKRGEIIKELINTGLWTFPDGAWCSSGIPVFQSMFECGSYPVFKHYNANGEDVTEFAESDCQTPLYFTYLENGEYNMPVINFWIDYLVKLQKDYNFDGFRISHTDFVVDIMSESNMHPISYRAPRFLLKKVNETLKQKVPYFASMAEYRLRGSFYKEYHSDMKFDVLWGNDVKTSYEKKPLDIINDNRELQDYNRVSTGFPELSILKTHNNQDELFRTVNRALDLETQEEAIFSWFKFKFIPGGKYANRPVMYVDGDETFSLDGIEATIEDIVSLIRNNDEEFYAKFDAIRRYAINSELLRGGEAEVISQNKDGFISWTVSKEAVKESLVVAANYLSPQERTLKIDEEGLPDYDSRDNLPVMNKKIVIPGDFKLSCEIVYDKDKKEFVEVPLDESITEIQIDKLEPCEFRIFKIKR